MSTRTILFLIFFAGGLSLATGFVFAHENEVSIVRKAEALCITSNNAPNHDIGTFPNAGNPHSFEEQVTEVCVDASPELAGRVTDQTHASGVTVTGIIIRPATADYFDASSPRGFSRDRSSGWNLEAMGASHLLGLDAENAHVDHRGLYHYHGVSESLVISQNSTLIGWAADGFEIHYIGDAASSGWQLREGERTTAPYGSYDGTYVEDWIYVEGSGNLDQCNAAIVDGTLTYFATDTFPFFPRCFHGTVSADFLGPV